MLSFIAFLVQGELDVQKIELAAECGFRLFYCESECLDFLKKVGNALQEKISQNGIRREEFFIIYHGNIEIGDVVKALQIEYLDVYLTYCKEVLFNCVKQNSVKAVGFGARTKDCLEKCSKKIQINLVESDNLTSSDSELRKVCDSQGIKILDKITFNGLKWNTMLENKEFQNVAIRYNRSLLDVLIKYCVQSGHVVVTDFFQEKQVLGHLKIFDFYLAPEDLCLIRSLQVV